MHIKGNQNTYEQYRFEQKAEITSHPLARFLKILVYPGFELGVK